jgi:adenosylcobinamide-phosphate synthase
MSPTLFVLAYVLDLAIGDPEWLPHPVRLMGRAINGGERLARALVKTSLGEFIAGALLTVVIVGATGAGAAWLLSLMEKCSHAAISIVLVYLASTTMATRSLIDEAYAVGLFLKVGELERARAQVSRIVGRDTDKLDESEVVRATVETLAENASDGIVAPMFYLALGGVPAALAYKAINTLDSMIGHRSERYESLGKCAARLDDAVNLIPARLTGLLVVVAAWALRLDWRGAWRILRRDGANTKSPNAGRPEAAMAGALSVRLGGTNYYDGEPHEGKHIGDELSPLNGRALREALRVTVGVSLLMFALCLSARLLVTRR